MSIILPDPPSVGLQPELEFNRRNTKAFIDGDPITVALIVKERVQLPDNGYKDKNPVPLAPQVFRLIPQSDVMPQVQTPDGVQLTPTYVLLGEWDCDMRRWAEFSIGEVKFKIVSPIRPDFRTAGIYERKGDVARI